MPSILEWKVIGTYRLDPLPVRPIPPIPKPFYKAIHPRKSILLYLPIVSEPVKEHVTLPTRWRL